MVGLAKIKSGALSIFAGAYTAIADDDIFTEAQRSDLFAAVAATSERFVTILSEETKAEMLAKFSKLQDRPQAQTDRENIWIITESLKGYKLPR